MNTSMYVYAKCMPDAYRDQETVPDSLELELQEIVEWRDMDAETKFELSRRVASVLNCRAISPDCMLNFFPPSYFFLI